MGLDKEDFYVEQKEVKHNGWKCEWRDVEEENIGVGGTDQSVQNFEGHVN